MTTISRISLEADSRSIRTAKNDLREMGNQGVKSQSAVAGLGRELLKIGASVLTVRAVVQQFTALWQEQEKLQRNMLRTEQLIKSTGAAAGFTAKELHAQAQALARATLQSTEDVMAAQQILLSYSNIQGDVFERAIETAADLASLIGGPLNGSLEMLAKTLDDPVQGINAMRRQGIYFSDAQQGVIKSLVETNRLAEAQGLILDELAGQFGGVARREAEGLAGAQDTLAQSVQEARIAFADYIQTGSALADLARNLADGFDQFTVSIESGADALVALASVDLGWFSTALEAVVVVAGNVKFVLHGILIELGGMAAQMAAISRFDFSAAGAIGDAMKADAAQRRQDFDAWERSILNARENMAALNAVMVNARSGASDYGTTVERLIELQHSGAINAEQFKRAVESLQPAIKVVRTAVAGAGEAVSEEFQKMAKSGAELAASLLAQKTGLSGDFLKKWNALAAAYKSGAIGLDELTAAQAELLKQQPGIEAAAKLQEEYTANVAAMLGPLEDQARALELQVEYYGKTEGEIQRTIIARMEEARALAILNGALPAHIKFLEREIEARRRIAEASDTVESRDAAADAAKAAADEWQRTAGSIEKDLTDALMRGFESGKGFGENLRDTLVNMFKTLVLRPLIQPVTAGMAGMLVPGMAGASSGAGGLGLNPMSLFGGNSIGMGVSNVMTSLSTSPMLAGTGAGNWLMGTAGNVAGMSNLALGGAGLLGGLGANLLFGGKGMSSAGGGLGSMAGMALGGPIGALAGSLLGGALGSLFGGQNTPTNYWQQTTRDLVTGDVISQTNNPSSRRHSPENLAASDALSQYAVALNAMLLEITGEVAAQSAKFGVGNRDKNLSIDDEVILKNQKMSLEELRGTFADEMISRVFEALPEGMQTVADSMRGSGEDILTTLVLMHQGFAAFSTDADRWQSVQSAMAREFERLNVTMPTSVSDFRRLADSIDLTSSEGRELYQSLHGLAPAFAELASVIDGVFDTISRTTAQSVRDIEMSILDAAGQYSYLDQDIDHMLGQLAEATLPQEIDELFSSINRNIMSAWQLLDEGEQDRLATSFIDRLYEAEAIAQSRLSVSPMDDSVQEHAHAALEQRAAAEEQRRASEEQREAAAENRRAAAEFARAVAGVGTGGNGLLQRGGSEVIYA